MTARENPVLLFFALAAMIAAVILVAKYRREIFWTSLIVGGGIAIVTIAGFVIEFVASAAYEGYTTKQCLTAYERAEKANAAPNDYWGNQLRETSENETKKCAELAARKQAGNAR
jgi:uncharacterized membrane protein